MLRADLLEKDTPFGWHTFVPTHPPGSDRPLWRCVHCHGHVKTPTNWQALGPGPCREFLSAIPHRTSPAHDFPPPPGQQRLLL